MNPDPLTVSCCELACYEDPGCACDGCGGVKADLTDVATHATGWYLSVLVVVAAAFLVALYGWSRA